VVDRNNVPRGQAKERKDDVNVVCFVLLVLLLDHVRGGSTTRQIKETRI
jgi:hypothetical protein